MDQRYKDNPAGVIYAEPVAVEDRPLPFHVRMIEEAKRALFIAKRTARRLAPRMKPALLLLLPMLPAALPLILTALAAIFLMKRRAAAGSAY